MRAVPVSRSCYTTNTNLDSLADVHICNPNMTNRKLLFIVLISLLWAGCRRIEPVTPPEEEYIQDSTGVTPMPIGDSLSVVISGFYLLNEGNMGSNKATIDYYDYATSTYRRDIYAEANPTIAKELGDVGNDLKIYGNRMYAVINCSNKVEVLDARTCKRVGQVDIPNCRYITFDSSYAYVSSYAGPVSLDTSHAQIGYVARIDTATLQIDATCHVGYQPDELEVADGKLYVANSGGYMTPAYDSTVSVIDLASFTEVKRIPVAINLHHVRKDNCGHLWVTSRGDYFASPSRLYCIDLATEEVITTIPMAVSDIDIVGDSLYCYGAEFSYITMQDELTFGIVNTRTCELITTQLITDGTDANPLFKPYCIKVHPQTRDFYVTDAKNYVTPGMLNCYSPDGVLRWTVRTGDIPAHIAFVVDTIRTGSTRITP